MITAPTPVFTSKYVGCHFERAGRLSQLDGSMEQMCFPGGEGGCLASSINVHGYLDCLGKCMTVTVAAGQTATPCGAFSGATAVT
jgi:hypothetical protein